MENYADDNSENIIKLTIDIESIIAGARMSETFFLQKVDQVYVLGFFFLSFVRTISFVFGKEARTGTQIA